ncbi:MAG: PIN domain-containing protein [Candidatus Eremiobacteraeota bacterium]|nr:PIN domain-containing protein [Candidatus Eremiobacteraeota bacterium]
MAQYAAVLDTCAIFGTLTRDLLLGAAEVGLYRPIWSDKILSELVTHLAGKMGCSEQQLQHLTGCMHEAFPEAVVNAPADLIARLSVQLKDPDDAHVIASALVGKADAVVTRNLEHFPDDLLGDLGLEAIHPDDFLVFQWDLDRKLMLKVAQGCHRKLKKSPPTWDEWLARLKKQGVDLHLFAAKLSEVEVEASRVQSQPERQS